MLHLSTQPALVESVFITKSKEQIFWRKKSKTYGDCSTQEFKVQQKETKKEGMLRPVIEFLWLVLVVSCLDLGEAITCYSCGPHSDQVIDTLDISKEQLNFR